MEKCVVGLDLGATDIKCGLVSADGGIKIRKKSPTDKSKGAESVLSCLASVAGRVISEAGSRGWEVTAAGVGTPGAVDEETGCIAGGAENIPGWRGAPLVPELEKKLRLPVFASNDVTLHALGEAKFGAGKGKNNIVCVAIGTGIGGGIVVDGKIYRGAGDGAGEVGHMTVKHDGKKCNCGSRGCLERYASATAISEAGREACRREKNSLILTLAGGKPGGVSAKTVFDAAKRRDPSALAVVKEAGYYLGVGLANLINLLNPEMIIIGGGVSKAGKILIDSTREAVNEYALEINMKKVKIVLSKLHLSAGVLGAAALCWQMLGDGRDIQPNAR